MTKDFQRHIENLINESIKSIRSLSGGDISQAYKISTSKYDYFLKVNEDSNALAMFQTEVYGLQAVAKTNTIKTPSILACDNLEGSSFLLLEYIESRPPSSEDFKNLGEQLAQLHQRSNNSFGLDQDNFIGRLPQSNTQHKTWIDFYVHERLSPQLEMAKQKDVLQPSECPNRDLIKNRLQPLFQDIKPSLLHGDLWSGNYLISEDGVPYLIDPAVYYGHNEVDIAMSKLFGGFRQSFYEAYFSVLQPDEFTNSRIEIYQLYYLLVHLNMFGRSYYGSVSAILKKYF